LEDPEEADAEASEPTALKPTEKTLTMRVSRLDDQSLISIRKNSTCHITFAADAVPASDTGERSLTISGSRESVKKAQMLIRRHQNSMDEAARSDKPKPLLDGEGQILETKHASFLGPDGRAKPLPGVLEMTTFRLRFSPTGRDTAYAKRLRDTGFLDIPLFTIARARTKPLPGNADFQLYLECKDMRRLTFNIRIEAQVTAAAVDQRIKFFVFAISAHTPVDSLFCCAHNRAQAKTKKAAAAAAASSKIDPNRELTGWQVYSLRSELQRQGLLRPEDGGDKAKCVPFAKKLRICQSNTQYELCPTYPSLFAAPARASDATVHECAQFRTKARLPMFCWAHKNGSSLWRCSQPRVGVSATRNVADEQMLAEIRKTNPSSTPLYICDCRPKVNAYANRAKGGGFEFSGHYRNSELHFQEIGNIHVMRGSLEKLERVVMSNGAHDLTWNSSIVESQWYAHVANVLYSSVRVCNEIVRKKRTVLVHCSDGWDRTAQSASLVQMLLDPFYRTIRGFQVIVCKEWLHAGHRFQTRIGHGDENAGDNDRSPIFIQFLDCAWQLLNQFPLDFEFNEAMLLEVADHLFSGRFGTFLFNNERERKEQELETKTASLWSYIDSEGARFQNPFYEPSHATTMYPSTGSLLRKVTLWEGYYTRFSPHPIHPNVTFPDDLVSWCRDNRGAIEGGTSRQDFLHRCILKLQRELLKHAPETGSIAEDGAAVEGKDGDAATPNKEGGEKAPATPDDGPNPVDEISQEVLLARKAELEEVVRKARAELNKLELQMD
jgi:myotubularin-related protein 1/2